MVEDTDIAPGFTAITGAEDGGATATMTVDNLDAVGERHALRA